jgi:hypothetical protein
MSMRIPPIIAALFTGPGRSQPVAFEWRLISRHGRPFLLLPCGLAATRTGLALYSAQRRRAKIWRKILPALLQSPLSRFFEHIRFQADASAEILQFMAQQAGIPAERIHAPAIKLSDVGARSRLVLLLCDEGGRPARVIKAGLNEAGRRATDQEADFLEQLPANKLGCIRMTGRLSTPAVSAFATDYFPGTSPYDDAGLEHLFHDWLNRDETVPLESLPAWRDLAAAMTGTGMAAWPQIQSALAGKKIRSTLYHGDFAPWNVRVVNSRNLQAFDWERGGLAGIPGWDWFHFVVQTAILARRHSVERAAAEVEQLLYSDRFKNFAAAAGISDLARPLLLAYLLHHKWVVKPLEGGKKTEELFKLLSVRWQVMPPPSAGASAAAPEESASPGLLAGVAQQLKSAASQLGNLFWEPSLAAKSPTSLRAQFSSHRPVVLLAGLILAGVVAAQYCSRPHLTFLPLYLVPCSLLAWKIGRRWAMLAAIAAAVAGPLIANLKQPGYLKLDVMMWNMVMRFLTLQLCVLFVEQIHRHKNRPLHGALPDHQPGKFTENWAVVLASGLLFTIVAALDYVTPPQMSFLPLYLLPCMVLTLVFNLRWGIAAALVAAVSTTLVQYFTNLNYKAPQVFGWNLLMHFAIYLFVVLLLDRIRRGNILFSSRNHRRPPASRG